METMNHTSSDARAGMTLVELLLTLVILVGLVTSVSVATGAFQERAKADATRRQGAEIVRALLADEGLSLVGDLGRAPTNAAELVYLYRNGDDFLPALPGFAYHPFPAIPQTLGFGSTADCAALNARAAAAGACVGAGWRGPYLEDGVFDPLTGALLDGFGGAWVFDGITLTSLGRDQTADDPAAELVPWQDRDSAFPVNPRFRSLEAPFVVRLSADDAEGLTAPLTAYVCAAVPQWDADGVSVALAATNLPYAAACAVTLPLSVGCRTVLAYVTDATGAARLFAPPRPVMVRTGGCAAELKLERLP